MAGGGVPPHGVRAEGWARRVAPHGCVFYSRAGVTRWKFFYFPVDLPAADPWLHWDWVLQKSETQFQISPAGGRGLVDCTRLHQEELENQITTEGNHFKGISLFWVGSEFKQNQIFKMELRRVFSLQTQRNSELRNLEQKALSLSIIDART